MNNIIESGHTEMISHSSSEQTPQPLEECNDLPDCCEEEATDKTYYRGVRGARGGGGRVDRGHDNYDKLTDKGPIATRYLSQTIELFTTSYMRNHCC